MLAGGIMPEPGAFVVIERVHRHAGEGTPVAQPQ